MKMAFESNQTPFSYNEVSLFIKNMIVYLPLLYS